MGCAASYVRRSVDKEVDVVSLCREKKHQLKLAVKCRSAFAEAQCKYNHSLLEVASAISLFVGQHSSPTSPVTSAFGDSDERVCEDQNYSMSTSMQKNSKGKEKVVDDDGELRERQYDDDDEVGCEQFYNEILLHKWDFFDSTSCGAFGESSLSVQEKLIPDLLEEEVDQEIVVTAEKEFMFASYCNNVVEGQRDSEESETPTNESPEMTHDQQDLVAAATNIACSNKREILLEALKDVGGQFLRAHEAGLHLSKMLEVSVDLEGHGGNSNKSKRLMTLNQTCSSSSLSTSSSTSASPDWGAVLISGSHQMTLVRLYEWQKKLYKEVKDGHKAFKLYKRKCIQLLNKETKEGDPRKLDNIRAETKQLYSTLLVSLQSTKIISERIKKIRDEELHLQLVELLNCLSKTWKIMFESHEIQGQIMHEVGSSISSFNESHCLASLQLLGALQKWCANFSEYVYTQKAYVRAVDGWLRQFLPFEVSFFSKDKSSKPSPSLINRPPLLILCQNWLATLKLLPDEPVARALESFCEDIRALWIQQGTEIERGKHLSGIEETKQMALTGFHAGFSSVFESLTGFSKASVNMYSDLIVYLS